MPTETVPFNIGVQLPPLGQGQCRKEHGHLQTILGGLAKQGERSINHNLQTVISLMDVVNQTIKPKGSEDGFQSQGVSVGPHHTNAVSSKQDSLHKCRIISQQQLQGR